jgi:hypothetical protein
MIMLTDLDRAKRQQRELRREAHRAQLAEPMPPCRPSRTARLVHEYPANGEPRTGVPHGNQWAHAPLSLRLEILEQLVPGLCRNSSRRARSCRSLHVTTGGTSAEDASGNPKPHAIW